MPQLMTEITSKLHPNKEYTERKKNVKKIKKIKIAKRTISLKKLFTFTVIATIPLVT